MRFRWKYFLALCLLPCLSFADQRKSTHGDVADAGSLLRIHTFCIDSSSLSASELRDLRRFAAQAENGKGVFNKMHWLHVDNCDSVDAIVKLHVSETVGTAPMSGGAIMTGGYFPPGFKEERHEQAGMAITGRASGKMLYAVKGKEFINDRQAAFEDTFAKLSKDLKTLSK